MVNARSTCAKEYIVSEFAKFSPRSPENWAGSRYSIGAELNEFGKNRVSHSPQFSERRQTTGAPAIYLQMLSLPVRRASCCFRRYLMVSGSSTCGIRCVYPEREPYINAAEPTGEGLKRS